MQEVFDQGMDEVAGLFVLVVLIAFGLLLFSAFELWQQNNQPPALGPWEETGDAAGVWSADGSLRLGEAIQWQ